MYSFITGVYLILVDFPLRLSINVPYIFSVFIISDTDMGQFEIILVDTMCMKFFAVGSPILLYIFLANLALSIWLEIWS